MQRGEEALAVPVQGGLAINHFIGLRRAAVRDPGVVRLPRYPLTLVELLPDWQLPATPISLVYPGCEHPSMRVWVLRDFVANWASCEAS